MHNERDAEVLAAQDRRLASQNRCLRPFAIDRLVTVVGLTGGMISAAVRSKSQLP